MKKNIILVVWCIICTILTTLLAQDLMDKAYQTGYMDAIKGAELLSVTEYCYEIRFGNDTYVYMYGDR